MQAPVEIPIYFFPRLLLYSSLEDYLQLKAAVPFLYWESRCTNCITFLNVPIKNHAVRSSSLLPLFKKKKRSLSLIAFNAKPDATSSDIVISNLQLELDVRYGSKFDVSSTGPNMRENCQFSL